MILTEPKKLFHFYAWVWKVCQLKCDLYMLYFSISLSNMYNSYVIWEIILLITYLIFKDIFSE